MGPVSQEGWVLIRSSALRAYARNLPEPNAAERLPLQGVEQANDTLK
jgi:hypothetical protein